MQNSTLDINWESRGFLYFDGYANMQKGSDGSVKMVVEASKPTEEDNRKLSDLLAVNFLQACIVNRYLQALRSTVKTETSSYLEQYNLSLETEQGRRQLSQLMFLEFSRDLVYEPHFIQATKSLGSKWSADYVLMVLNKYNKVAEISMQMVEQATAANLAVINFGGFNGTAGMTKPYQTWD